ncbi:periplasmic heavy metal sensor [Azospirillum sp. SYSU D00513]|uniref:periplasmic heavy metal sensor n=1 Tax=Azospirillum sp. SYSU D00513 TaxID=2812561 RepID=UPI001A973C75|nr:periplasmic heavy metal sensor [Azospirillum sp. SYSU D00513]
MTRTVQRRWPWYLLVASLAGNMLLGGVFAARFFHHPPPPGPEHAVRRFVERASEALPPADSEILRQAFEAERGTLARMGGNMEELQRRLRTAAAAKPFDAEALNQAFETARTTDMELRRQLDAKVIEVLGRMSEEGRRRLVELGPGRPGPRRQP